MTVASTARRVQFTVGSSGQQGPYAFAFKVLDQADLAVYVGSTTASTLKTLTTHYTVSLSADGTGTITFASGQYPTEAQLVTIIGDKAYSRTTDFTAGGDIRAATLNSDGDAQAIFAQQLDENLTRAIQVPIFGNRDYTSDGPLQWPYDSTSNNASKLVAYNSAGNALELTDKAVSAATVSASDVAVTSAGAAGTATASVTLSGAGALAFALGIPVGQTGMTGGVSMQYSTTTADADPGAGFIRFNHATLSSATIMYVDDSDGTTDITAWVQSWDDSNSPNRGSITGAGNPNTSSPLSIFNINGAVTDASGYTKIPVAYVAGTTSITNNAEVSVSFAPSGDGDYAGLDYVFSTTTTDSDPGAGTVRLNNGTLGSVTAIFVDDADANTANVEDYLLSWDDSTNLSDRGLVRVTKKIAPANYALYKISGASTDASGYVKLAVTHVDSNGSFSDADTVAIEFSSSGNIGIPTGLNFTYSTTTTDSDPGSGVIRFNNATLSSASLAYVDDADSAGANIEALVLSWDDSTNTALRGTITLVKRDNPAIFAIWNITGASVDGSGYSKLALTYVTGTGSFTNNDAVVLSFVRTGNAGVDASYVFKTISVSGQDDVVGDSATDTLTLANGAGIAITTTAGTDTITIAATGPTLANGVDNRVVTASSSSALNGEANLTFDGNDLDVSGDITGSTLNADGDTSAGDNAAIGYTAAEGLILTGQGSVNDITLKRDDDTAVLEVATGQSDIEITGGSIFFGTASEGIYLGATSATAANLLDDYEEGTWTAVFRIGGTSGTDNGDNTGAVYTKVGRLVHIRGNVNIDSTISGTGNLFVTGLPFAPAANNAISWFVGDRMDSDNLAFTAGTDSAIGIYIMPTSSGGTLASATHAILDATGGGKAVYFAGTYYV